MKTKNLRILFMVILLVSIFQNSKINALQERNENSSTLIAESDKSYKLGILLGVTVSVIFLRTFIKK